MCFVSKRHKLVKKKELHFRMIRVTPKTTRRIIFVTEIFLCLEFVSLKEERKKSYDCVTTSYD